MSDAEAEPFAPEWPHAWGGPPASGVIRQVPEDFRVEERLSFTPSDHGEHVFLLIEKRGANTEWVAKQLARFAGVSPAAIGYAGLKDRHASVAQWFSVHWPKSTEANWQAFQSEEYQVVAIHHNERKLRRGALAGNRFRLVVREVDGDIAGLQARLALVAAHGVPNYFGEQRFGRGGRNVDEATAWLGTGRLPADRMRRSMVLSAARSLVFNAVLAERVADGSWQVAQSGDALMRTGSNGFFVAAEIDDGIANRIACLALHPSGPLWGAGALPATGGVAALEHHVAERFAVLRDGLSESGADMARRALRLAIVELTWKHVAPAVQLEFSLPPGGYATAVLREVFDYRVAE